MLISAFTSLKEVAKNMVGALCGFVCDRFRNIEHAASIRCPVLLIHGKQDKLVPWSHSQMIAEKLECGEVQECYQETMTHNEYDHDVDIISNITSFLKDKMLLFQKANDPLFSKFEKFHQRKLAHIFPEVLLVIDRIAESHN